MIGLLSLELYSPIFEITEKNINFELYKDTFDELSIEELKDELEEIPNISIITPQHLQHEIMGPRNIEAYKKLKAEKSSTDGYNIFLMGYARSSFRDFESYLRIVIGIDEDDIPLIPIQNNSNFVTHELSPGIYSNWDISEVVYIMGDHEGTVKFEYEYITMKTKNYFDSFWWYFWCFTV